MKLNSAKLSIISAIKTGVLIILLLSMVLLPAGKLNARPKPVIIGYVGGFRGLVNTNLIDAKKLTHINYAFVDIKDNRAWLHREATDTINFRNLVLLKKQNPALKILISIGGWTWSGKFSDAVFTDTARQGFAASAVAIIKKFNLDGIDIDWEYPARQGLEGNIYRPDDKHNYTLMFQQLRRQLDTLQHETGKPYLLTTAVGGFKSFTDNTEMGIAQQYLDYINLMTYDFSGGNTAIHHTALYASKSYPQRKNSDDAVNNFIAVGVPVNKLVMGIAFYSHAYTLAPGAKGLGDSIITRTKGIGYTAIKDSILTLPGFKIYRDKQAKADYIYNAETHQFLSFDDVWSVRKKCIYVKSKKMAGAMFWEYDSDLKGYLLDEINRVLR